MIEAVLEAYFDSCTPREREVLHLVLQGHRNTHIAKLMGISVSATQTHLYNIQKRHGAHSRTSLLAQIIEEAASKERAARRREHKRQTEGLPVGAMQ